MALAQRIESLKKRHSELDTLIRAETAHPASDDLVLHRLKAEKLSIKDDLYQLMSGNRQAA